MIDLSDRGPGSMRTMELGPGESAVVSASGRIPRTAAPGENDIGAIADFGDQVRERNETNNTGAVGIMITDGGGEPRSDAYERTAKTPPFRERQGRRGNKESLYLGAFDASAVRFLAERSSAGPERSPQHLPDGATVEYDSLLLREGNQGP